MKKSKRILALVLSVMLIVSAFFCVPFSVSAAETELSETGANFATLNSEKIIANPIDLDKEYIASVPKGTTSDNAGFVRFEAEQAGYYVLKAKNENMPTDDNAFTAAIVNKDETVDHGMGLATGEEGTTSARLEANELYYVKFFNDCESFTSDGFVTFSVTFIPDPEPDKLDPAITSKTGEYYEGNIAIPEDVDYIFVSTVNDKKHCVTLENRGETAASFKAEVYDTNSELVGTATLENGEPVTVEFKKPSEVVSYYICVSSVNGSTGDYAVKLEEVKPVATNVHLDEDFYDSITRPGAEGSVDYLKFTTIDKDAYYTIYAKNIDINTHSWSLETGVQVEIKNANSEEISRISLLPASEGAVTLKLQPNTTYYMNVYNKFLGDANGGNYKIKITYVLDPDKNEMENATEWSLEEKYYGDIAARGDHDWFKITTNENTDYTFTLKNTNIPTHSWSVDLRFRGVIYNDKNESLATVMLFANEEGSARVNLEPNTTYYIAIFDPQGTTGEYSFDLSVTVIIDKEAVGMANAPEVPYNEDYYDSITNWDEGENVDYLKFTTLSEPAYYTITAKNINIPTHSWSGDNQVQVNIINEHKEVIQRFTLGPEAEGAVTYKFDENTTYFIKINNNENSGGNYKVKITYVLDPEANEMTEGKRLRIGEKYFGNIAARGDSDYFKITTTEETDYTLVLKNISISTHSWSDDLKFRAVIYNEYNENLGQILLNVGNESMLSLTLKPETTYYIGVFDPEGTTGDYSVMLAETLILGDVTLDGKVKIQDATNIQKNLAKLIELDETQLFVADVTGDTKVNIKDATAIQKYLAKIEVPYAIGQLIPVEHEYPEEETQPETGETTDVTAPATTNSEAVTALPEPSETAPQITTAANESDPAEVPATTETKVTVPFTEAPTAGETVTVEPTEAPSTTDFTEQATTTTAPADTVIITTEPTEPETTTAPVETKTYFEQLKELVEACETLRGENEEYADEAPLDSQGLALKAEYGFDISDEATGLNEYYKFRRAVDKLSYDIGRGYTYTEEESYDYIVELIREYNWFKHYVTNVNPTPSGRVIYFQNTKNWKDVYVFFWNETDEPLDWPGKKMELFSEHEDMYCAEIPAGYDKIIFSSGDGLAKSVEITLSHCPEDAFYPDAGYMESGVFVMVYYCENFGYHPFDLPL